MDLPKPSLIDYATSAVFFLYKGLLMPEKNENSLQMNGIFRDGYGLNPKRLWKMKIIDIYCKAVASYMLSYTGGGTYQCFPKIQTIADDLDISKTTVIKSLNKLYELKFIHKTKLFPNNPMIHANKYILDFMSKESIVEKADVDSTPDEPSKTIECTSESTLKTPSEVHHKLSYYKNINNNNISESSETDSSDVSFKDFDNHVNSILTTHNVPVKAYNKKTLRIMGKRLIKEHGLEELKRAFTKFGGQEYWQPIGLPFDAFIKGLAGYLMEDKKKEEERKEDPEVFKRLQELRQRKA